jgi:hypothetical protein
MRVWVGAFEHSQLPTISWRLRKKGSVSADPVSPHAIRPLAAASPFPSNVNTFTGIVEFDGLDFDTSYTATARAGTIESTTTFRTLPRALGEQWFNVLILSCYHHQTNNVNVADIVRRSFLPEFQPHVTFLLGDQVYLDLPTFKNFEDSDSWLARRFESDYVRNWLHKPAFADVFSLAPSVMIPDDHEFWNNAPHWATVVENSWTRNGRRRWLSAARAMLDAFQSSRPTADLGLPFVFSVPPLSFCLADNRTFRAADRSATMTPTALEQIGRWSNNLATAGSRAWLGVLATGQPLSSNRAGRFSGSFKDYEMPNYGDFFALIRMVENAALRGGDVLSLTGDVHWARVMTAQRDFGEHECIFEVVSSPAALVRAALVDELKAAKNWVKDLFGHEKEWYRHTEPGKVPDFFAPAVLGNEFPCHINSPPNYKGDMIAIVSFSRLGDDAVVRTQFANCSSNPDPTHAATFTMRRRRNPSP